MAVRPRGAGARTGDRGSWWVSPRAGRNTRRHTLDARFVRNLKRAAARFEGVELIEARAGRREQDDVALVGDRGGPLYGLREVAGDLAGHVVSERRLELRGGLADQQDTPHASACGGA